MIKKIFTILLLATALVSCVGPQGPMGPQGEPGEGINWKVYDMTVNSNDWELINGENGNKLGSYFMYVFEGDQAPKSWNMSPNTTATYRAILWVNLITAMRYIRPYPTKYTKATRTATTNGYGANYTHSTSHTTA